MQNKNNKYMLIGLISLLILAVFCVTGCKQKQDEQSSKPEKAKYIPPEVPIMSINEIIASARDWSPAYQDWVGKEAPDFTLKGIDGKNYKLSDFRGKNVVIVFWATWCGPCKIEIPHLIALRNVMSKDDLQILAITNEEYKQVRDFAAKSKMNYAVLMDRKNELPAPFDKIRSIPTSFFIDPQGKIKLATAGSLTLGTLKAIARAK
ncbi:MAG: TlpA family protein disulfide reductase [Planctomycetes bacterium]|nr:TlpA family protein disulfide reductase [Planctomycetota bacterium]